MSAVSDFICSTESLGLGALGTGTSPEVLYVRPGHRHLNSFQWAGNHYKNNRFVFHSSLEMMNITKICSLGSVSARNHSLSSLKTLSSN